MEPHPVYNAENKNKLPPRSPGKCKSHTPSNSGKQQQCLKIYWESGLSNNSRLHTNKVCISGKFEGVNWRARESDCEIEGREGEREREKVYEKGGRDTEKEKKRELV